MLHNIDIFYSTKVFSLANLSVFVDDITIGQPRHFVIKRILEDVWDFG